MTGIADIMRHAPVIPVITIGRLEHAAPLARALVAGGLRALEVTLRTPVALDAIRAMRDVESAVVGAGTVRNSADVEAAFSAGARFFVSPGLSEAVVDAARITGAPLLPGVATASDIMRGLDLGLTHFKLFPAEQAGGVAMLKAFAGPFGDVRFCPTGGVTPESARTYLALPNVLCVGGTWVAPSSLVEAGAWDDIRERARTAAALR